MGKRTASKPQQHGSHNSITLREQSIGKNPNVNVKSKLKHQHLQKLAVWAAGSTEESSIPSLAAFFGQRLASAAESLGIQPDPSLFPCQRCETVLQPGLNCTIRIEKKRKNTRRRSKKANNISTQNNVVYSCQFCSHKNLRRGTPKGHMKEICPPKARPSSKLETSRPMLKKCSSSQRDTRHKDEVAKVDEMAAPAKGDETPISESPGTPILKGGTTLLDAKRRKRNRPGSKKPVEPPSVSTAIDAERIVSASTKKRRRQSWTSLKEIAESSKQNSSRNIADIKIPFFL